MAAHRYWRLLITDGLEDELGVFANLNEMQLRASAGGLDETGTGTASASSEALGGDAALVFDDDADTSWATGDFETTWPQWVAYDFGAGNDVDVVEYAITAANYAGAGAETVQVFHIQWSDDGSAWTDAEASRDLTGTWLDTGQTRVFTVGGGEGVGSIRYTLTLPLRATTRPAITRIAIGLRATTSEQVTISITLRQTVDARVLLSVPLRATTTAPAALSVPLRATVTDGTLVGGGSRHIAPWATLGGVDVSARLTGPWQIDREASRAAVCEFTLLPAPGTVDVATWLRAPVQFGVVIDGGARAVLFTGEVDEPVFDPVAGLVTYTCTDARQARLDAMTRAQIDAAIEAYWSAAAYSTEAPGSEYAAQRLETVPADWDLSPLGAGRLTPWATAATPHFTLTANHIIDETAQLELARPDEAVNRVTVEVEVRYQRRHHRAAPVQWSYGPTFHNWIVDNSTLPDEAMIRSAATQGGWQIRAEHFTGPPITRNQYGAIVYQEYNGVLWRNDGRNQATNVLSATLTLVRRWAQTITERYTLDVRAPASIDRFGETLRTDHLAWSPDAPPEAQTWLDREFATDPPGGLIGGDEDLAGATVADAWTRYLDDLPDADRDALLLTAVRRAWVQILSGHRAHTAAVVVPLLAEVDLPHTVRVETARLIAQGRVRQIVHSGDASGQDPDGPLTMIRLALSQSSDAEVLETVLGAPPRLATAPTAWLPPQHNDTHLGRRWYSPEESQDWRGYVGNYVIPEPVSAPSYDERFVIDLGETPRDGLDAARTVPYAVAVPHDELTVTA